MQDAPRPTAQTDDRGAEGGTEGGDDRGEGAGHSRDEDHRSRTGEGGAQLGEADGAGCRECGRLPEGESVGQRVQLVFVHGGVVRVGAPPVDAHHLEFGALVVVA